jgi:hypothetical protein
MLKNSLKLASKTHSYSERVLSPEGRLVVIYSDLSELLGLGKQTIEELFIEIGWLVLEKQ